MGGPGLGGLPPTALGTVSSPSFSQVGLLTAASSPWSSTSIPGTTKPSWENLVPNALVIVLSSGLSTSSPVDGLFSSSSVVELLADLAGYVTIPAAAAPEAPLGADIEPG